MGLFRYKAVTGAGETVEGRIEALSRDAAIGQLRQLGYLPIRADEHRSSGFFDLLHRDLFGARKASRKDVVYLTREIATLLAADIELEGALEILTSTSTRRPVTAMLNAVLSDVRGGSSLADALTKHEQVFPSFYISMVRAGEAGGGLVDVFERLAEYLERAQGAAEQIRTALIYPIILLVMAGVSIAILIGLVLPEFRPVFESMGQDKLPGVTRIVMASSDLLRDYGWLLVAGLAVCLLGLNRLMRIPLVRYQWDAKATSVPVIGGLIRNIEIARIMRTLGTLLANGVPVIPALDIVQQTVQNRAIQHRLAGVGNAVKQGRSLPDTLGETAVLPVRAERLLRVGDESGRLEAMLIKIADIYDEEVLQGIRRALSLLTPALTILLGAVIAGIVSSMFVAILSVNEIAL